VAALHAAPAGDVWVGGTVAGETGAEAAAARFDGGSWELLTAAEGLAGTVVQAVAADADGRTWFGSDAGISVWDGNRFFVIDRARGLPSDDIRALAADTEGVWIGAAGGGLYRFAGSQLQLLNRENVGLPSDTITHLALGPGGTLWIGSDAGLARLAGGELAVVEEIGERAITSLAVTAGGEVWVGVGDEGMFYSDGRRWTELTLADRLPARRVTAVVAAPAPLSADGAGDSAGDNAGDNTGSRTEDNPAITGEGESTVWLGGQEGGIMRFQQ
jgi:ligand-binding sensor domain-containing protein